MSASASISLPTGQRNHFDERVEETLGTPLTGLSIETVQVNIGLRCNLACRHCHVKSSPRRTEEMTWETMLDVLTAARRSGARRLDITGGAPEMHPHFRAFVDTAIGQGLEVMVRTNLTVLLMEDYSSLPYFLADRAVHLVASLPCYLPDNVDKQRGKHVYRDSVEAIRQLNHLGYGHEEGKILDLVYNPLGPSLPPNQKELEHTYRTALFDEFGIRFNNLYAITNIAIGRFLHDLARDGEAEAYQHLLREAFNPGTVDGLMCRHQLHVGHDGTMYDCDFNYALGMAINASRRHVREFDPEGFLRRIVATGEHCFACTAGSGSSCGGALT